MTAPDVGPIPPEQKLLNLWRQRKPQLVAMGITEPERQREHFMQSVYNRLSSNQQDIRDFLWGDAPTVDLSAPISLDEATAHITGNPETYGVAGVIAESVYGAGAAFFQMPLDLVQGLLNFVPGVDLDINIKTDLRALARKVIPKEWGGTDLPLGEAMEREQMLAQRGRSQAGGWSQVALGAGEVTGSVLSLNPAMVSGKLFGKVSTATANWAKTKGAGDAVAGMLGGAAGFSMLNLISGRPELEKQLGFGGEMGERAKAALLGGISGAVFDRFLRMGQKYYSNAIRSGLLGKGAGDPAFRQKMMDGFASWTAKTGKAPPSDPAQFRQWFDQTTTAWFGAGAPGAGISWPKIKAYALRAGIESVGLSAIDIQFLDDVYSAIAKGDEDAITSAMSRLGSSYIASLFLHAGSLRGIPRIQRRLEIVPFQEPGAKPAAAQPPAPPETPKGLTGEPTKQLTYREPQPPAEKPPSAGERIREERAQAEREQRLAERLAIPDWAIRLGWREVAKPQEPAKLPPKETITEGGIPLTTATSAETPKGQIPPKPPEQPAEAQAPPTAAPEQPAETVPEAPPPESRRVEIPDSPYHYDVTGDVAVPSPKLREALKLPETMPRLALEEAVERAHLASALQAKTLLPGTEISVEGVKALDPTEKTPGKMVTIRFGEVLERPLAPVGKWRPAEAMPSRPPDQLSQQQEALAVMLNQVRQQRVDLLPHDAALLESVVATIASVDATVDPSIAESLPYIQQLLPHLAAVPPEQAGSTIKAMAEMLTTKLPAQAIADMASMQKAAQEPTPTVEAHRPWAMTAEEFAKRPYDERTVAELRELVPEHPTETAEEVEAGAALDAAYEDLKKRGLSWVTGKLSSSDWRERAQARGLPKAKQRVVDKYLMALDAKVTARAAASPAKQRWLHEMVVRAAMARGLPVPEKVRAAYQQEPKPPEGELGPESGAFNVEAIADLAAGTYRDVTSAIATPLNWYAGDYIRAAIRAGAKEFGERARKATETARMLLGDIASKRDEFMRTTRFTTKEFARRIVRSQGIFSWSFRGWHAYKDSRLGKHLGISRESLSAKEQQALRLGDDLTRWLRRQAHAIGVEVEDTGQKVRATTPHEVMVRHFTPAGFDAIISQSGKPWEAIKAAVAEENRKTLQEVERDFTEARSIARRDPIEFIRRIDYFPDAVLVDGTWVDILVTEPQAQIIGMLQRGAMRLGVYKEFGPDRAATEADPEFGELPTPYRALLGEIGGQHGRPAAEAAAQAMRAMHGLPTFTRQYPVDPNNVVHKLGVLANAALSGWAAMKLGMGFVPNLFEPFASPAARLGFFRLAQAEYNVWSSLLTGKLPELIERNKQLGAFSSDIHHWGVRGEPHITETARAVMKNVSQAALLPFQMAQAYAELVVSEMARIAGEQVALGNGTFGDRTFLRSLGFTPETVDRAMRGEEPEIARMYTSAARSYLMGGKSELPVEKSEFSSHPVWPKVIRFQGFFTRQQRGLLDLLSAIDQAKDAGEFSRATGNLGKFLLANFTAGAVSASLLQSFKSWFQDGGEGFIGWWRELFSDPLQGVLFSLFTTIGGGAGGALIDFLGSFFDAEGRRGSVAAASTAIGAVAHPIAMFAELVEGFKGVTGIGDDPESPYAGKPPIGRVSEFVTRLSPFLGSINRAVRAQAFKGLAETDPSQALSRGFEWLRRHGFLGTHQDAAEMPGLPEQVASAQAFQAAIKNAIAEFKKTGSWGDEDVQRYLAQAYGAGGWEKAADHLRRRRFLSRTEVRKLSPEQRADLVDWLGPHYQTIQWYDHMLDILADDLTERARLFR